MNLQKKNLLLIKQQIKALSRCSSRLSLLTVRHIVFMLRGTIIPSLEMMISKLEITNSRLGMIISRLGMIGSLTERTNYFFLCDRMICWCLVAVDYKLRPTAKITAFSKLS